MAILKILNSIIASSKQFLQEVSIGPKKSVDESQASSKFSIQDSASQNLPKLEQRLSTARPFNQSQEIQNLEQSLELTRKAQEVGPFIPVNPYVHEPKIEEFLHEIQTPLVSTETMQKGVHALALTQPAGMAAQGLSDGLDLFELKNPIKPVQQGVEQAVSETLSSMTSPQNILLAEAGTLASFTPAGPYVAAFGAGALIPSTLQSGVESYDAFRKGDLKEGSRNLTHAFTGAVAIYGGVKYGLSKNSSITSIVSAEEGFLSQAESIKLAFDPQKRLWTSEAGLQFGPDPIYGNRIQHVFQHLQENTGKTIHTVFKVETRRDLLPLIEEAWTKKAQPVPGKPREFIADMERVIGLQGETHIKIIVNQGTREVITAYPVEIKK